MRAGAHRQTTRAPYWFWLLGLLNNASYVIMIASAKSIDAGGVAVVYLVAIGPGLAVKATAPYWFDLVRYEKRLLVAALSMVGGFLLAGLGGRRPLQLLGVALTSFQSALGEATVLALAARHDEGCVSAWSSGTGFAGIVGYGWVWLFTRALRLSMAACQSLAALSLPLLYVLASRRVNKGRRGDPAEAAGLLLGADEVWVKTLADDGGPVLRLLLGVRAAVRRLGVDGRASTDEEA